MTPGIEDYKRCEHCNQEGNCSGCDWWKYYWNAYWLASPWGVVGVIGTLVYSVILTYVVVYAIILTIF